MILTDVNPEAYQGVLQNLRWKYLWQNLAASKMELIVTKVNGFQLLTFLTKTSILDFVVVVDMSLQPALWRNYSCIWL